MQSLDINNLVSREQYQDKLREIKHLQLVKLAQLSQTSGERSSRKVANWLGNQMIKWGTKLQKQGNSPAQLSTEV